MLKVTFPNDQISTIFKINITDKKLINEYSIEKENIFDTACVGKETLKYFIINTLNFCVNSEIPRLDVL